MLPPDEFFQMPYFKKKSKSFEKSFYVYDVKYSPYNVHKSIVEMLKSGYITANKECLGDLFLNKINNSAYLELTDADLNYIKGE